MIFHDSKKYIIIFVALLFFPSSAWSANEGQEDLDKATESKLSANTLTDLGEVIRLTESAMQKGLDESNTKFAEKLLVSSLVQRATVVTNQIFKSSPPDQRWPQFRQFALSDLEKAVKLDANQPQAMILIAQLNLLPEGDEKRAKEAVNQAIELSTDDPQIRSKALIMRSGTEKNLEKRLPDLNEAVRLMPNDSATIRARGLVMADLEKYDESLADLNKAIELDSKNVTNYDIKSIVLTRMKRYDEALATLDQAQKLVPGSVSILLRKTGIHSLQKKIDEAIEDLNRAIAIDPINVNVLLLRSGLYLEKGDKEKALSDAQEAVRLRKDAATILQLGMIYASQKKSNKAVEVYTEFLNQNHNQANILRARGDAFLNVGKQAEAVTDYKKAYKDLEKDAGFLNNFAWVLSTSPDDKLRDGPRALKMAANACEMTEYKQSHILSTLAAAYAETGDFDNAIKWSMKSAEIGDDEHAENYKSELETYKAHKPFREALSEEEPEKAKEKTAAPAEIPADQAEKTKPADDNSSQPGENSKSTPEKNTKTTEPAPNAVKPFNGKNLDGWSFHPPRNGSKWTVGAAQIDPQNPTGLISSFTGQKSGDLVNFESNSVDIYTDPKFADCSVALEFMIPKGSDSGVYLMGEYEVQIADSFGKKDIGSADLGALSEVAAPKVNAAKAPGEWQTLVVYFKAPRFQDGKKISNAQFEKIILNGQVVNENIEIQNPSPGALTDKEVPEGPLMLQGSKGTVAFRNIKITTSPAR